MHKRFPAPALISPTPAVRRSFHTALAELQSETEEQPGRGYDLGPLAEVQLAALRSDWDSEAGFARFLDWLDAIQRRPYDPDGLVPTTTLWWVAGEEYLGRITLRHRLNRRLMVSGGNLGYAIRPSARRQGHARAMLAAALAPAAALGIEEILLTVAPDNMASQRVARGAGAVLDDGTREPTRDVPSPMVRFWLPTGA